MPIRPVEVEVNYIILLILMSIMQAMKSRTNVINTRANLLLLTLSMSSMAIAITKSTHSMMNIKA